MGELPDILKPLLHICTIVLSACLAFAANTPEPKPPGKLVDLGGHRLHMNCTGKGSPTVVVENGLGDAATYPREVAGMVLVDAAHEGLRVGIGGKKTLRLGDGARGTGRRPGDRLTKSNGSRESEFLESPHVRSNPS